MFSQCQKNDKISHFYTEEQLALLSGNPMPRHVAIIMDGNRRWATQNGLAKMGGHWAGALVLTKIVAAALDLGLEALTVFAFSTENWERSPQEVEILLKIFQVYLEENFREMIENGVRFHIIGDPSPLSDSLKKTIESTRKATEKGEGIDLVIAFNYGGRHEICRVIKKMIGEFEAGRIEKGAICEKNVAPFLDTAPFGDPDLLIRTSGERRVSNFLLWQLAYSEIHVTDTLWPDFTPEDLLKAVIDFQTRKRRNGK